MKLSHRTKLAVAVLAALVLPSLLAWGFRSVSSNHHDRRTPAASTRTSPSPSSAAPTSDGSSATPAATPSTHPSVDVEGPPAPAQQAQRLPSSVVPEAPTRVQLSNGRVVRVRPSDSLPDGSLGIPDDLHDAAWWRGGARLGDLYGSLLVAAHVDSAARGLGPFVQLLYVHSGARVTVSSAHLRQVFKITARRILPRGRLARAHWVSSFSGPHRLTLVTCAPPYDKARGGYQNLAVVVAVPVGPVSR